MKDMHCLNCGTELEACDDGFFYVCPECGKQFFVCEDCGELEYARKEYVTVDGTSICEACFDSNYFVCDDCGNICPNEEIIETANERCICESCFEENYYTCDNCGDIIHADEAHFMDGMVYCDYCYEENTIIKEYHDHKGEWRHFGDDNSMTFGFELEVENKERHIGNEEMASKIANSLDTLVVFEHDGSLNDGFEIISQPMTLKYFKDNQEAFMEMLDDLDFYGFVSHEGGNCGLHFHVNRNDINHNDDEALDNIIAIVEGFKDEIQLLSRRKGDFEYCHWVTDEKNCDISYKEEIKACKNVCENNRYHAINMTNNNTVEFRMFRGTLKQSSFLAALEFVERVVKIACDGFKSLTWNDIIADTEYLAQYSNDMGIEPSTKVLKVEYLEVMDRCTFEHFYKYNRQIIFNRLPSQFKVKLRDDLRAGSRFSIYVNKTMERHAGCVLWFSKNDDDFTDGDWRYTIDMFDKESLYTVLQETGGAI